MRKYVLGVVAMVLSYSLFSFTEIKKDKTSDGQQSYYFVWNQSLNQWSQVDSEDDFPDCPPGTALECTATSNEISGGQPSGEVDIQYRRL